MRPSTLTIRTRRRPALLLAVLLLVLQIWLPILSNSNQASDSDGRAIWICTLQGFKLLLSDDPESRQNQPYADAMQCPICSLGQLFSTAVSPTPSLTVLQLSGRASYPPIQDSAQPWLHVSAVQARAPPLG